MGPAVRCTHGATGKKSSTNVLLRTAQNRGAAVAMTSTINVILCGTFPPTRTAPPFERSQHRHCGARSPAHRQSTVNGPTWATALSIIGLSPSPV